MSASSSSVTGMASLLRGSADGAVYDFLHVALGLIIELELLESQAFEPGADFEQ